MKKILVIDDEKAIRNALREVLEYEGYVIDEATNGEEALHCSQNQKYDVILCDIKMPQMDGIEVLDRLMLQSDIPVIMISGHGDINTAVDTLKRGAYDYIPKPLDLNRLLISVRNALEKRALVKETQSLKRKVSKTYEMIGETEAMLSIKAMINKVAATDARVLITGNNGTGKELVARWLHELSQRSKAPFIEVNCAAIPSELIESVLFGHEKGSFTSAIKQRKGNFEEANGGTLFLDEIGDMSLDAQAKVLRALQENKISRIGGSEQISVDVRVIAATNKNLRFEIENNKFREDLYHRLSVILIHVPDLKERKEDIPLLINHFANEVCTQQGRCIMKFNEEAINELKNFNWSGNIRELRNVVERLSILCDNEITLNDVKKYTYQNI